MNWGFGADAILAFQGSKMPSEHLLFIPKPHQNCSVLR